MRKYFLLPHRFLAIGWGLLVLGAVLNALEWAGLLPAIGGGTVFTLIPNDGSFLTVNDSWTDEVEVTAGYLGLYFIAMSALREEDELTLLLRLRSLMWSFTVSAVLFVALDLLVYGFNWLYVVLYQGLFIFVLFILRFHWELRKMRREGQTDGEGAS